MGHLFESEMVDLTQLRQDFKEKRIQSEQDQIREFNSIPSYLGYPKAELEPQRYQITMMVTGEQWTLMEEAFNLLRKQCEGYKKRAINNPSETIKSYQTEERQQNRINQLDDIISRFQENVW